MNPASIALKVASLVFSGGILIILFKKIKVLKKYGLASIIYVVLLSLLLAFPTLFNLFAFNASNMFLLVCAQAFVLIIGILHVVFAPGTMPWYREQPLSIRLIFMISILFLAYFFTNLSLIDLQDYGYPSLWYMSLFWFFVPFLLNETVNEYLKVPRKIYKLWHYPVNQNIADPSDEELENPIVISFIFKKNETSSELTTFRAKAPVGMQVGRLFYFFINDYNSRHPESNISFMNDSNEPNGWIIKKVRNQLLGLKEVIDPDISVYVNEIRENDLLYCYRINNNK
jgi:hypothetical protein